MRRRGSRGVHPARHLFWFSCRGHNDRNSRGGTDAPAFPFRTRAFFSARHIVHASGAAVAADSHTVACFNRDRHDAIHARTSPHRAPIFMPRIPSSARSHATQRYCKDVAAEKNGKPVPATRGAVPRTLPHGKKSLSVPEARPFIMTFLDVFRMTRAAAPYA